MKKTSLSIAVSLLLCTWGQAVLAQFGNTTVNGQLRVSQEIIGWGELYISKTATFYDKVQIGSSDSHPGLFTNGPTWLGTGDLHQPVNIFGSLSVSDNTTLGTTDVNGNMMLHRDVFLDGSAWLGHTNIGSASQPRLMSVYGQTVLNGPLFVGSSSAQQQISLNGGVFIGTPQAHGLLNLDGDALLHNNLTVDQGTTLVGRTQIGDATHHSDFFTNGPTWLGTANLHQPVNVFGTLNVTDKTTLGNTTLGTTDVNGNMMMHNDVFVDGTTWLGSTNVGGASNPKSMNVYGQTVLNGNLFVGTPQAPTQLNVDGGVFLHNNLRVDQATTMIGQTQIGDATHHPGFFTNGPSNFGTPQLGQEFNVYGFATLHNSVAIEDGLRIGTVNVNATKWPQYKLWVQKGIVSEDYVIAPTSEWADFVFNEGYKLPSLKELETYIKTNKHLPQIPTQTEVEKDGYSMRQLNSTLLQKVEELTLYTIEQDKKLEALTAQMAEMKAAIEKMKK
jgi:hypothetical protein